MKNSKLALPNSKSLATGRRLSGFDILAQRCRLLRIDRAIVRSSALLFSFVVVFSLSACGRHAGQHQLSSAKIARTRQHSGLVCKQDSINLGGVYVNDERPFQAFIQNVSGNSLTIGSISGSCGCTHVTVNKFTLDRNESGVISGVYRAGNLPGLVQKSILIITSDNQLISVPLIAMVNVRFE